MELLDRYLQAVKKHLPWERQDDILAELRANLESQLEDQEAEIGRPLTAAEVETWLKQIGPPMMVAARYQKQQYVIGPTVFPMYWYVIRIALFWVLAVYVVMSAVLIFSSANPSSAAVGAVVRAPFVLMNVVAWVTLSFAAFEFAVARSWITWPASAMSPEGWSPSSLPPLEKQAASGRKPRTYAMAIAELVMGFLFLGWLLLVRDHPVLMFGPGAVYMQISPFQIEPVWYTFYWWVVGLNFFQLTWRYVDLMRRSWQGPRIAQQTVTKLLGLIPLLILINAPDHLLITLKHPVLDSPHYGVMLDSTNVAIHRGLMIVCVIVVLQLLWELGQKYFEEIRKRMSARH
jgi:hypothetical protein